MDKQQLGEFLGYYCKYYDQCYQHTEVNQKNINLHIVDHMYEKYGREFIFDLPVVSRVDILKQNYLVILNTWWVHSVIEPAYYYQDNPVFCLLGMYVELDYWLPHSALSPEEQTIFKLKYG